MQRCKFCRCTKDHPCKLVAVKTWNKTQSLIEPYIFAGAIAIVPPDAETFLVPCAWLLDDVCTNPRCAEKAYGEAREFAIAVQGLIDKGLVEISDDGEEQLLLTNEGELEAGRLRRTA